MPSTCVICGHLKSKKSPNVSMHRFPVQPARRAQWLKAVGLTECDVQEHSCICSRHFLHGDTANPPSLALGKRFASPKKLHVSRGKKAVKHQSTSSLETPSTKRRIVTSPGSSGSTSRPVTPALSETTDESDGMSKVPSATVGEPLLSDYSVHELPVDVALTACIEALEVENRSLCFNVSTKPDMHVSSTSEMDPTYKGDTYEMLPLGCSQQETWQCCGACNCSTLTTAFEGLMVF